MVDEYCPRLTKKIRVTDDWYPCFDGNTVEVCLTTVLKSREEYYVILNAWGADDTGVEMQFASPIQNEVISAYLWFKSIFNSIPDGVDREWFLNHGFCRA